MAVLTANKARTTADLHNMVLGEIVGADSDEFYEGAIVMFDAAGAVAVGADTAGAIFAGICSKRITTAGSNTLLIPFERGHVELLTNNGNILVSHHGEQAYLVDDGTVGLAADVTNNIPVGRIEEVTSDGVLVATGVASLA